MSKRNIIITVVIVILIGAAAGYYFLYLTEEPETLTEDATQTVQEVTSEEEEQEESDEILEESTETQDLVKEQELQLDEKYAYRQELRNPFGNVVEPEPVVKQEDITFPFRLDGIISNGNQRIAVLTTSEGPRFISNNEYIGDYYFSNVGEDQIKIRYKYVTVYMKIGGALVE